MSTFYSASHLETPTKPVTPRAALNRKGRGNVWLRKSADIDVFMTVHHITNSARWLLIQERKFPQTLKCCQGREVNVDSAAHSNAHHRQMLPSIYINNPEPCIYRLSRCCQTLTRINIIFFFFFTYLFPSSSFCLPPKEFRSCDGC